MKKFIKNGLKIKYFYIILLGLFLSSCSKKMEDNYEKAMSMARSENKPVMIYVTKKTCPACKDFYDIFNNNLDKLDDFVILKISWKSEDFKMLTDKYKEKLIGEFPIIIFLSSDEKLLALNKGKCDKNKYFKIIETVKYIHKNQG